MDDLISRRVVIDMLSKQLDYLDMLDKDDNPTAESKWYGINWARNMIADLPSIQPERKKGKWINDEGLYKCSSCGEFWARWWIYKELNYCPYCGADMREGI